MQSSLTFGSTSYPTEGAVTVSFTDPVVFQRWQDNGGDLQGGEVIPGTTSVRLNVNPPSGGTGTRGGTGTIAATLGRIPLGAGEESTIILELEAPVDSEPLLEVRQRVGGQDVGGSVYGPPVPLRVYLPLSATSPHQPPTPTPTPITLTRIR